MLVPRKRKTVKETQAPVLFNSTTNNVEFAEELQSKPKHGNVTINPPPSKGRGRYS